MPLTPPNSTPEQIKAVESIVPNAQEWLQAAWDQKAANSTKAILHEEIGKIAYEGKSNQERSDWVRDNTVKTRVQKDIDAAAAAANL